MTKIVLFGPGPLFKGGIANYNTSLAKAFDKDWNFGAIYHAAQLQQFCLFQKQ